LRPYKISKLCHIVNLEETLFDVLDDNFNELHKYELSVDTTDYKHMKPRHIFVLYDVDAELIS